MYTQPLFPQTNWILNATAESNVNGWNLYNNGAVAVPTTGTAGTVTNLTLTQTTTNPISGLASLLITKTSGQNIQGEGLSYDFTVDRANLARIQQISATIEMTAGSIALGDITIWVYDKTNSVLIQPVQYQFPSAVVGTNPIEYQIVATFQTNITSSSYRLIFHFATTVTNACTFKLDNVVVGPQQISYGSPDSDWVSYTPATQGMGTVSNMNALWRRVGDSMEIVADWTCGTTTSSQAQFGLPFGTIDPNKVPSIQFVGTVLVATNSVQTFAVVNGSNSYIQFALQSTWSSPTTGANAFASNQICSFRAVFPILGWSSAVRMSQPDSTRTVAFEANGSPPTGTISGSSNVVIYGTTVNDTHAAYNASTGVYTIPVSGWYSFEAQFYLAFTTGASNIVIQIYKNGATLKANNYYYSSTASATSSDIKVTSYFNAGDTVAVYSATGASSPTFNSSAAYNFFSGHRIAGPERIAASEKVYFEYNGNSGQSLTGSTTNIIWNTKVVDSHNAYSTSTGLFTAPLSAMYVFTGNYNNTTNASDQPLLYYNGSLQYEPGYSPAIHLASFTVMKYMNAGDTIGIRSVNGGTLGTAANANFFMAHSVT